MALISLIIECTRMTLSSVPIWRIVTSGNIAHFKTRKEVHYITLILLKLDVICKIES